MGKIHWIVDPENQKILVLVLVGEAYRVHGEFGAGEKATSSCLSGFDVSVAAVLAAE